MGLTVRAPSPNAGVWWDLWQPSRRQRALLARVALAEAGWYDQHHVATVPPAPNGATDEEFRERFDEISRDLSRYRLSRDSWTMIVFALTALAAFAACAAIFSIVGMGLALRTGGGETAGSAITAELTEFAVTVSTRQIDRGGTLTVHNGGAAAHDLKIPDTDLSTGSLEPACRQRST